ncbi:unnamed protein product, partial [Closterium sp. NIES-65]
PPPRTARKVPLLLLVSLCACFLAMLLLPRSTLLHPHSHDRPPMQSIPLLPPRMQIPAAMRSFPPNSSSEHRNSSSSIAPVHFFVFGDWGRNGTFNQSLIAMQMGLIGAHMHPQFVVSLGDNFLELGLPDVNAPQFAQSFTNIYTHRSLQIPCWANHDHPSFFPSPFPPLPALPGFLGNHDYYGNVLAQLHPALANRDPRWTCRRSMALSLPICAEMDDQGVDCVDTGGGQGVDRVDSGGGQGVDRVDSEGGQGVDCVDFVDLFLYDSMPLIPAYRRKEGRRVDWRGLNTGNWSRQEEAQLQELEGWLSNSQARWKVVGAHHPVFSYGKHGDQPEMVERIKPLLEKYGVDVYINGHDRNMQHIKKDESPVHYFTVGGGSKAWRGDAPPVAPGLRFFFPGQGFSALEELRDLQPTLLDAATYAEEAYLVTDQKDMDYAVSMLVSVVDRIGAAANLISLCRAVPPPFLHCASPTHRAAQRAGPCMSMLVSVVDRIGAAADRFTDAVSLQAKEMAAADVRVASAAEILETRPKQPSPPRHSIYIPSCALKPSLLTPLARPSPHIPHSPDPRGSSHTALSSSSLLSSMPLAPPSESLLDSLASSSLVPRSATASEYTAHTNRRVASKTAHTKRPIQTLLYAKEAVALEAGGSSAPVGMPSVRASLDCLAGLPPSSSSTSSSSSFPSFSSSFPFSTVAHSSSTLSNPSAATPHSADKILSRKQSHSHNLSHSPNLAHSPDLSHSHNLSHFSNLSRSHNLSQSHGLMHSLSHSLSQHMGHRGSHARQSKEPTTPKGHFPLVASSLHAGGASGVDDVEGSDRRSTTPHRRGRQLLKNIFSRGAGGAGAGAAGASGALGDGSGGYMSTQRAHDRGYSGHL